MTGKADKRMKNAIVVIPFRQHEILQYEFAAPAKNILSKVQYALYEHENPGKGYQRALDERRTKDCKEFVQRGNIRPTALLLNQRRDEDGAIELLDFVSGKPVKPANVISGRPYYLAPNDSPWWCMDGMHRVEADRLLFGDLACPTSFDVPVVLTNLSYAEEVRNFYIVNSTAKSVDAALAQQLMAEQLKSEGAEKLHSSLPPSLTRDLDWKPKAAQIVRDLYNNSASTWFHRIHVAGLKKEQAKACVAGQKTFVSTLAYLLRDTPQIRNLIRTEGGCAHVEMLVDAFWHGVRRTWPECFVPDAEKKVYTLTSTIGLEVLHRVLSYWIQHGMFQQDICDPANAEFAFSPDTYYHILSSSGWTGIKWHKKDDHGYGRFGTHRAAYEMAASALIKGVDDARKKEAEASASMPCAHVGCLLQAQKTGLVMCCHAADSVTGASA